MKRVAIVGAGVSGLVAIKSCLEEGLEPVCYEQHDNFGGLWYYTDEYRIDQGARAYDNMTSTVCKDFFAFSDFPPPEDTPVFLTCSSVYNYLHAYCNNFGLLKHIQLGTKVKNIQRSNDHDVTGRWVVETTNQDGVFSDTFDFVIVASGAFKTPWYPNVKGLDTFKGVIHHSIDFKNGEKYKGKKLLVVGNSYAGADLSNMSANHADQVSFSVAEGAYVAARLGPGGVPWEYTLVRRNNFRDVDEANKMLHEYLNNQFDQRKAGIAPHTPPWDSKILINDEIKMNLLTGKVKVVSWLVRIGENEAEFDDGTVIYNLDAILFATGYDIGFPFLEELKDEQNKMMAYKMVFPLQFAQHTLGLVGMVSVDGAAPPVSELQARIVARVFAGRLQLPSMEDMHQEVERVNDDLLKRYGQYKYVMPYLQYKDELAEFLGVLPTESDLEEADEWIKDMYYTGPALPYQQRVWGPHSWAGARQAIQNALERGYYVKQPRVAPEWKH